MAKIGKYMGVAGFALAIMYQVMRIGWYDLIPGFMIPDSAFFRYLGYYGTNCLICLAFLLMFAETKSKSDLALLCCFGIEFLITEFFLVFVPDCLIDYIFLIFDITICIVMIINATKNGNTLVSVLCCVAMCLFIFGGVANAFFDFPYLLYRIIYICTNLIFALYCITKEEY